MPEKITRDTPKFQRLVKELKGASRKMTAKELSQQPVGTYVLTGDNTKEFGGGPSADGLVMIHERVLGRILMADVK